MLTITRKRGEGLYIGRGIRVTVLEIESGGQVRIGIEAPKSVVVSRDDFTHESHVRRQALAEVDQGVESAPTKGGS